MNKRLSEIVCACEQLWKQSVRLGGGALDEYMSVTVGETAWLCG